MKREHFASARADGALTAHPHGRRLEPDFRHDFLSLGLFASSVKKH
jgi:hypothetical protein